MTTTTPYTPAVLREHAAMAAESAAVVVPLLLQALPKTRTVVDVGCGLGAWLAEFRTLAVPHVLGIDGPWVPRDALLIPRPCFVAADLRVAWSVAALAQEPYDLCLCLEVAEHLEPQWAEPLVSLVCVLSNTVFWSAAVPGQGGHGHVNEAPMSYWRDLFAEHRFYPRELPGLAEADEAVKPWYRRALLYTREER